MASEVQGLDKNQVLWTQRLVLPDNVDEVLRGKNQLGCFRVKFGNQLCRLFVRDHPRINTNLGISNVILQHTFMIPFRIHLQITYHQPFDPVLQCINTPCWD